jgi:hypothetical protein
MYKNPKEPKNNSMPKSSSNGSSFKSNSSFSSGLSSLNNLNDSAQSDNKNNLFTTMMMMMPLAKNKSPSTSTLDEVNSLNASVSPLSPPPPKPNRNGNLSKLVDFSPSKLSSSIQKSNYLLKSKNNDSTGAEYTGSSSNLVNGANNVIILNRKDIDKQESQKSEHVLDNFSPNKLKVKRNSSNSNHSASSSLNTTQVKSFDVNDIFFLF